MILKKMHSIDQTNAVCLCTRDSHRFVSRVHAAMSAIMRRVTDASRVKLLIFP